MIDRQPYAPANAEQLCQFWSAHVNALEHHLSANKWALAAVTVVLIAYAIAYPIARSVIPAVLHSIVPDVVRSVLNFI